MRLRQACLALALAVGAALLALAHPTPTAALAPVADPVVLAAGDISPEPATTTTHDIATSRLLLAGNPTVVAPLGDNQYQDGQLWKYTDPAGYAQSWGRLKDRTCAVVGNHDYLDPPPGPAGFLAYFRPPCFLPRTGPGIAAVYAYQLGTARISRPTPPAANWRCGITPGGVRALRSGTTPAPCGCGTCSPTGAATWS
jgi:hypothetical protein